MSYNAIETDIVDHLGKVLRPWGIEVVGMPSVNADKEQRNGPRVTVGYVGSEFDAKQNNTTSQKETVCFGLIVQAKELSGREGTIYNLLHAIKARVIGFTPKNCQRIRLHSIEATEYVDGIWTFTILVKCDTYLTAEPADEASPLFLGLEFDTLDYQFEEFNNEVFPE